MTKEELHVFATAGIAQKIATMEQELATYHKEWPELFLSPTAPQLLKAPTKNGSNGHWPPVLATDAPRSPRRPTPAGTIGEQRQRSRRILALLEGKPPLYAMEIQKLAGQRVAIGSYLRNGYLRQVGDKYSRTNKPFVLSAWEAKKKKVAAERATTPTRKPMSKATRRKLALAMKKRHASGDIARAKAAKTSGE